MSLAHGRVEVRLPAKDLSRANADGGLRYNYPSKGRAERGPGSATVRATCSA
jgi:hypothetical protein